MQDDSGALSGSHPSGQAPTGLVASRVDPGRVPPLERPPYCKPQEFLLLASYCGNDNDACTERRPCADCLAMCNIFGEGGEFLRELGVAKVSQ